MFCKRGHTPSVIQALQRSFRFAGRIALGSNIQQKLVAAALNFKTEAQWQDVQEIGREDRAHGTWKRRKTNEHWQHRKGWTKHATFEDGLIKLLSRRWRELAGDEKVWKSLETKYVEEMLVWNELRCKDFFLNMKKMKEEAKARLLKEGTNKRKRAVIDDDMLVEWRSNESHLEGFPVRVDIKGDSSLVCSWVNGTSWNRRKDLLTLLRPAQNMLYDAWCSGLLTTAEMGGQWLRHTFRENNRQADAAANEVLKRKNSFVEIKEMGEVLKPFQVRLSFDGACAKRGSSSGWVIEILGADAKWHMAQRGEHGAMRTVQ